MINIKYHFPRIDDLFDHLKGVAVISKIDLRSGYHEVCIKNKDIYNFSFQTKYVKYEFFVVPCGMNNPLDTFMCLMNSVLHPYLENILIVFINDILIYSKNEEEHEKHLETMLKLLR